MSVHPTDAPIRIVNWNMGGRKKPWPEILAMNADLAAAPGSQGRTGERRSTGRDVWRAMDCG